MGTKIERENMKKKVLLGMSGGVDSSVSAIILQEQGYEVIGVTLNLFSCASCCSYIDVKSVCSALGIPHFIIEGKDVFQKYVINDFINCYKKCTTPNPCIECNKYMKFGLMYEKAKEDKTFRTDIPKEEFMRVTVHTMMTACAYYAGGFVWGSKEDTDYTPELIKLKEMILAYATLKR